jgi:Domain of unknown function (DUF4268)
VNLIIGGANAKQYFHILSNEKDAIESAVGVPLQWRELPEYKGKPDLYWFAPAIFTQHGRWPEFYTWLADVIDAYSRVFGPRIRHIRPDQFVSTKSAREALETGLGEPGAAN